MLLEAFAVVYFIIFFILVGTATIAWRGLESPTVNLFGMVAGTLGIGSLLISVAYAVKTPVLALGAMIAVAMIIPIPWIIFAFDYIGKEDLISPFSVSFLAIPVVIGLAATMIIFMSQILPWFTFLTREGSGIAVVITTVVELSQWGGILYAGGIVLTGTGLILWSFQRYPHLDSTTGTVLCTFGTVPWVSVLFALQLQSISFFVLSGTVAIGFGIGTIAAVALVGPLPLFDRVPAAGNVGPTTVIQEIEDAVIVIDGEGKIIELNPSARRLFESGRNMVSVNITEVFDSSLGELHERSLVEIESKSKNNLLSPTVSELTDQHGHLLGYAIVLRDVTETRIREQRLNVINRFLRHNLRNDMSVVLGRLSLIQAQIDDQSVLDSVEIITETGWELTELSEQIRDSENLLEIESETIRVIQIESLVRNLFERVQSDEDLSQGQTIDCRYQGPEEISISAVTEKVEVALENLITNAVKHNDGNPIEVRVRVSLRPEETYPLEIVIEDNGPGIPEQEQKIITRGQETSLIHSSGIGLWTVRWIMQSQGGKISFDNREQGGTSVKLFFPSQATEISQTETKETIDSIDEDQ